MLYTITPRVSYKENLSMGLGFEEGPSEAGTRGIDLDFEAMWD